MGGGLGSLAESKLQKTGIHQQPLPDRLQQTQQSVLSENCKFPTMMFFATAPTSLSVNSILVTLVSVEVYFD